MHKRRLTDEAGRTDGGRRLINAKPSQYVYHLLGDERHGRIRTRRFKSPKGHRIICTNDGISNNPTFIVLIVDISDMAFFNLKITALL